MTFFTHFDNLMYHFYTFFTLNNYFFLKIVILFYFIFSERVEYLFDQKSQA